MIKPLTILKKILQFLIRLDISDDNRKECSIREIDDHIKLIRGMKNDEIQKLVDEKVNEKLKEKRK
ncbi:hypothetical protein [Microviridae sp.]|nr:hypothetical protein [Microviridae sp.]